MSKRWINLVRITLVLIVAALIVPTRPGQAQGPSPIIIVNAVDSQAFPQVTVQFTALDEAGQPLTGLSAESLQVQVDDQPASVTALETVATAPVDLVLAFDLSLPVETLAALKIAADQLVADLNPDDQVAIVVFHNEVTVIQDFTSDKSILQTALSALTRQGDLTAFNEGVAESIALLQPQTGRPKAVLAVTDRLFSTGQVTLEMLTDQARQAEVRLYPVNLNGDMSLSEFESFTLPTGGRPIMALTPPDILPALTTLVAEIRTTYQLTFQSDLQADNESHPFTLQLSQADATTTAQAQLVATSNVVEVQLVGLTAGQKVGGLVDLTVQVASQAPGIAQVEYLLGVQPLASITESPFEYRWDSTTASPGAYDLTARVIDSAGNQGENTIPIQVIIPVDVKLTISQTQVQLGDRLPLMVAVEALNPITKVEVLLDGQPISSSEASPGNLSIDSSRFQPGSHTLTVRATDSLGQVGEASQSLSFVTPPLQVATSVPTPVPQSELQGRPAWFRGLSTLILVTATLAAIAVVVIVLIEIYRAQRRRSRRMFRLEIANLGNIRSRYELLADDLADALIFQFFLDGASLHQRQVTETVPTALSSPRQTTEPTAVPTAPAPSVQPTSTARPVGQTFGFIGGLVDLLSSLVMILPRSVSGPLQNWLSQYRRVQSRVRQTQRVTQRVGRLASAGGVRSSSNVAVMSGGTGGALPAVTESNPTSAAPVQVVDGNGPAAVYEVGWTPPIEPGETLLVDLQIDPVKPYKHQHYPFRVTARSLESEAAPLIVEEGSISIQGLSWIRRFWLPVLVVILGVGVVSALVLFLLNNLGSWVL